MNAKTLKALKASIKSWEKRAAGTYDGDEGPEGCALCKLFHDTFNRGNECNGCPVKKKTRESWCGGTPYIDYDAAVKCASIKGMLTSAAAEVAFLKSLLPEGEK